MRFTLLLAVAAIFGAVQDKGDRSLLSSGASTPPRSGAALHSVPVETPAAEVCVGDVAPDFSYQGPDARWRRLRDLVSQGPVLLVFGANEGVLRIIDGERDALMDLGIIPVAVSGTRLGVTRTLVNRLGLRYTVLADPRGVIASQFNSVDAPTGRQLPSWFVVDARCRVRGLGRQALPLRGYTELASVALGLPPRTAVRPAAH